MLPICLLTAPLMPGTTSNEEELQALATALALHTETPVSVVRGPWREAPPAQFLIALHGDIEVELASCDPEIRREVAARTVVFGTIWPNAIRLLEEHRMAGAIDLRRYWLWSGHPESDTGNGIFGLISVAERAGMRAESVQKYGSRSYGLLGCPDHCRDLPSLLVHYLTVYEELGLHLRREA